MTLDAERILQRLKMIRPEERQKNSDARQGQAPSMSAAERLEYVSQHPEYGGSRG